MITQHHHHHHDHAMQSGERMLRGNKVKTENSREGCKNRRLSQNRNFKLEAGRYI